MTPARLSVGETDAFRRDLPGSFSPGDPLKGLYHIQTPISHSPSGREFLPPPPCFLESGISCYTAKGSPQGVRTRHMPQSSPSRRGNSTRPPRPAPDLELQRRDTEIAVAVFRTIFLLIVLTSRQLFEAHGATAILLQIAVVAAAGYNLALFVLHTRGVAYPRVAIVAMDMVLFSLWLYYSGPAAPAYFGLYYINVVVASLWFGVPGGFLTALFSALFYGLATYASGLLSLDDRYLLSTAAIQSLFLMLTAGVVSIAMEIQSSERQALATSRAALQQHWQRIRIAQTIDQMIRPPRLPQIPGLDVAFRYRPAAYSVSGEYYDVIRLGPRRAGICIADFAVRWEWGLQYLYAFKNSFRLAARREQSPARVLTLVNREMEAEIASDPAFRERPYAFASMCYLVVDLDQGVLTYANAGNEPPVLVSGPDGTLTSFDRSGIVLNVTPEVEYEESALPLHTGDTVLLFTDGLTEVRNGAGEFLGREGLIRCIQNQADASTVGALVESVFHDVTEFSRQGHRRDDMTLLAVRVTASDLGRGSEDSLAPLGID